MDERKMLIRMVKALLGDIQNIQQRGAGYYAPSHFIGK